MVEVCIHKLSSRGSSSVRPGLSLTIHWAARCRSFLSTADILQSQVIGEDAFSGAVGYMGLSQIPEKVQFRYKMVICDMMSYYGLVWYKGSHGSVK